MTKLQAAHRAAVITANAWQRRDPAGYHAAHRAEDAERARQADRAAMRRALAKGTAPKD